MRQCLQCQSGFEVAPEDRAFYERMAVEVNGEKFSIPDPTLCPKCRFQRRLTWRNDRKLYHRKTDIEGKEVISMFAPDSMMKVVHKERWYSDQWDARDYGREYDFSRPFFEQFKDLMAAVPLPHIMVHSDSNSLYTNYTYANHNCYMCFAGNYLEDSLYCYNAENSRDCVDCLFVFDSELCYEGVHLSNCYNVKYSLHSRNCQDSAFLENCANVSNSFMCWNLNGQQYCFLNKQYTKEEYEALMAQIDLGDPAVVEDLLSRWLAERGQAIQPENHNMSSENCTGEYILNSKNCSDCYIMGKNCEDCRYVVNGFPGLKDSQDCTYCGENTSLLYECTASGADCYKMAFCNLCFVNCSELYYCVAMTGSKNCFGSMSMRNAEYCILNKQYSKEEYEALLPRVIEHMKSTGEWGQFFPAGLSPFGYNESAAQDFFTLAQEQAVPSGFNWKDDPARDYDQQLYEGSYKISEVSDQITKEVLACDFCDKNFKITKQELAFYRKMKLAVPMHCFDCRHTRRLSIRNGYERSLNACESCGTSIETSYAVGSARVFCKACYLKEIYG
jgi:hypothetical protein